MSIVQAISRTPGRSSTASARKDARLLERVRAGDELAFEAIFKRHHPPLLAYARHILASQDEAEDALQQAFIRAHRALLADAAPAQLRPWLYAIVRNCCLSAIAQRRATAALCEEAPSLLGLSDQVREREDLRELLGDIGRLPEQQRSALLLAELDDLSHQAIATVVGCEVSKVKALIYQARSTLIAERDARNASCREIREELSVARGGELRRGPLRRHLNLCVGCRDFQSAVSAQRRALALALPVVASTGLTARILGHGAAHAVRSMGHGSGALGSAGASGGVAASGASTTAATLASGTPAAVSGAGTSAVIGGGVAVKVAVAGAIALATVGAVTTHTHFAHASASHRTAQRKLAHPAAGQAGLSGAQVSAPSQALDLSQAAGQSAPSGSVPLLSGALGSQSLLKLALTEPPGGGFGGTPGTPALSSAQSLTKTQTQKLNQRRARRLHGQRRRRQLRVSRRESRRLQAERLKRLRETRKLDRAERLERAREVRRAARLEKSARKEAEPSAGAPEKQRRKRERESGQGTSSTTTSGGGESTAQGSTPLPATNESSATPEKRVKSSGAEAQRQHREEVQAAKELKAQEQELKESEARKRKGSERRKDRAGGSGQGSGVEESSLAQTETESPASDQPLS